MDFNKKEMPIQGFAGFGGGVTSLAFTISSIPADFDFASVVNGLEDSSGVQKAEKPVVAADPHNEDRWAIGFTDDDGNSSKRFWIRIATRSGTSLTLSDAFDASDTQASVPAMCFCTDAAGKILIAYNGAGIDARVISFSGSAGSESFTRGTKVDLSNYSLSLEPGGGLVPMNDTGRYLLAFKNSSAAYIRIITVSGTTITFDSAGGSDAISLSENTSCIPMVAMDPDDDTAGMMCLVNSSEDFVVRPLTFSGSGTSANVSVGSQQKLTAGTNDGGGYVNNEGWQSLMTSGSGKYIAFARGGDSPHNNKLVGVAFDYNGSSFTIGNAHYAPENHKSASNNNFIKWVGGNNKGNKCALIGKMSVNQGSPSSRILYAFIATRNDDRTIDYTDADALGNDGTGNTGLYDFFTATQSDDAQTTLSIWNDNTGGVGYSNLAGRLWQLGSE